LGTVGPFWPPSCQSQPPKYQGLQVFSVLFLNISSVNQSKTLELEKCVCNVVYYLKKKSGRTGASVTGWGLLALGSFFLRKKFWPLGRFFW
jgi:hypothetical protein